MRQSATADMKRSTHVRAQICTRKKTALDSAEMPRAWCRRVANAPNICHRTDASTKARTRYYETLMLAMSNTERELDLTHHAGDLRL